MLSVTNVDVNLLGDRLPTAMGVQFPWDDHPGRSHETVLDLAPMVATQYPITNEQYRTFLESQAGDPGTVTIG